GRFVLVEFHPVAWMFDLDWRLTYPYFSDGKPFSDEGVGDYVGRAGEALAPSGFQDGIADFHNPHISHAFGWGTAEVISALLDGGLSLATFREYPYSNGARMFNDMQALPGRCFAPPASLPSLPLMYGVVARKA